MTVSQSVSQLLVIGVEELMVQCGGVQREETSVMKPEQHNEGEGGGLGEGLGPGRGGRKLVNQRHQPRRKYIPTCLFNLARTLRSMLTRALIKE